MQENPTTSHWDIGFQPPLLWLSQFNCNIKNLKHTLKIQYHLSELSGDHTQTFQDLATDMSWKVWIWSPEISEGWY